MSSKPKPKLWLKRATLIAIGVVILVSLAVVAVRRIYDNSLRPVSNSQKSQLVTIPKGATARQIAQTLKSHDLIRSAWAFERYVASEDARDILQAGTYTFRPNQSVAEIVSVLTQGKVASDLFTILPAQRIDQIKQALSRAGYSGSDINQALDPATHPNHSALVDKPTDADLEGYLYPESFRKDSTTKASRLVEQSLDEMAKHLTPDIRASINQQGLSIYKGITLASIVEQEVAKPEDRQQVAQVFLKRLKMGMKLESDATADYGAVLAGQPLSSSFESAYNTYNHDGLTPTPISNVSQSSLEAVAHPASTDWLFFVSGDDGVVYFSKTREEHETLVAAHCHKQCSRP